ncbi:PIN domain-containing protein [Dolichospermum sp. ST_sed1]|nr:PIN domain-containing protein [Dolichospermum sp. ST_sed1]MDD1426610.1 PIN domain-containing protein [Dolichospermum sp. ST_sed9]MDD1433947.1 PIN domain-containing protein [Dolichospermum sp. ST_sed6]MDD1437475.1 PIN domain-containing protein [Dolichospermum sp. ST_sed10]MDD1442441.1 PIN domain-containing protein [Dolichospermum sp. ST_sed3]MDD1458259.1 PIN domain-containing protein [Dolichospermum sp. ST_sed7]MDD1462219.1 PIN domain-containing protein [Dolichospermum sp. ST_sed2]MDD14671
MKILLDTNIIIDNALEREPFWDASEQVLSLIEQGTIAGYISACNPQDFPIVTPQILTPDQLIEELTNSH